MLVELAVWAGEREIERHELHDVRIGAPLDPAQFDLAQPVVGW